VGKGKHTKYREIINCTYTTFVIVWLGMAVGSRELMIRQGLRWEDQDVWELEGGE
jgi:hypothetical protein